MKVIATSHSWRSDTGVLKTSWILFVIALMLGIAQPQVFASEKQEQKRSESKKAAQAEQRGTENLPFIIKAAEKTDAQAKSEDSERYDKSRNERWLTYSTMWLAAVTSALALFTFWLWGATRKLVIGSERTAERQLRAYVFVKEVSAQIVPSSDATLVDNWRISIVLENGGNTPTRNLLVQTNWNVFDEPLRDDFEFSDRAHRIPAVGSIGPGGTIHTPHIDVPIPIVDNLSRGNQFVYIWGWTD